MFSFLRCKWIPQAGCSVIRENRFQGSHYTARLKQSPDKFSVTGLNPDRTIIAPGVSLTTLLWCDRISLAVEYEAELSEHFWSQMLNLQVSCAF
jgi:hypothetical protein